MKEKPNTLFLIAKWGLHEKADGTIETHMWSLSSKNHGMRYVSLHRDKSSPAYAGGKITEIRPAAEDEYEAHQRLLEVRGEDPMVGEIHERQIIAFKPDLEWREKWPDWSNHREFMRMGYVPVIRS